MLRAEAAPTMPHMGFSLSVLGCFFGRFQPGTDICLARETVSCPGGASRVSVVPAPIVAPRPTVTGATSCVSEPMNTSSSITVRCLFAPS